MILMNDSSKNIKVDTYFSSSWQRKTPRACALCCMTLKLTCHNMYRNPTRESQMMKPKLERHNYWRDRRRWWIWSLGGSNGQILVDRLPKKDGTVYFWFFLPTVWKPTLLYVLDRALDTSLMWLKIFTAYVLNLQLKWNLEETCVEY